jgi:aspartate/methionine/tyrosine aminotransferase
MTGWRLGWVVAPPALLPEIGKLIEFSTTCAPPFVQRAGVAALAQGETTIAHTVARLRRGRDHLRAALASVQGIEQAAAAPGAMYNFFRIEGVRDSLDFCKRLVAETGLGLAPGIAFGPEGEGYLRWCYASSPERIDDAIVRLAGFLANARLPH